MYKELPEIIRRRIAKTGMSRKALSDVSGVSVRSIDQICAGHWNVTVWLLERIACALGTTATKLLSDAASRGRSR